MLTAGSRSPAGGFYLDSSCASLADGGAIVIPAGSPSVDVYYRDSIVGTPLLTVSSTSLASANQTETVNGTTGPRGPVAYRVGCACDGGSPAAPVLATLFVLGLRRSRRSALSSQSTAT